MKKYDPIFGLEAPIVFAHRGGAKETVESTKEGFLHALDCDADVLELDIRLTKDNVEILWHGPELDRFWWPSTLDRPERNKVEEFESGEFGVTYIRTEQETRDNLPPAQQDASRRVLSLKTFLARLPTWEAARRQSGRPNIPLNIELKGSKGPWIDHLDKLFDNLKDTRNERKVLLAAVQEGLVEEIRLKDDTIATNLSWSEQLAYQGSMNVKGAKAAITWLADQFKLGNRKQASLKGRAFETSHALVTSELVAEVHHAEGGIYPFLTGFSKHAPPMVDPKRLAKMSSEEKEAAFREKLFPLLDLGVDGVMTDYPSLVVPLVREWRGQPLV